MEHLSNKNRIQYIDGLKGMACLFVMFGHFNCFFRLAEDLGQIPRWFDFFQIDFIRVFVCESFWLYLFMIVSGYLAALSEVKTLGGLARKTVKRFFRLFLPIIGAFIIIYFIQTALGFHNKETELLMSNTWFQRYYNAPITIQRVFTESFKVILFGEGSFDAINGPYWVIHTLFYCPLLYYICSFVKNKIRINKGLLAAIALLISYFFFGMNGLACSVGMITCWYRELLCGIKKKRWICMLLWLLVICMPLGLQSVLYRILRSVYSGTPEILDFGGVYGIIYFPILIILLQILELPVKFFDSGLARYFSKISFGVYSFHWPLFCSLGALVLLSSVNSFKIEMSIILMITSTIIATLMLSTLYSYTYEKWCAMIVFKMDQSLKKWMK